MSEKENMAMDPYVEWAHSFGRKSVAMILIYMFVMPAIICTVYDCWPTMTAFLSVALPMCALFWPIAASEVVSYSPILGSSVYISFVTGNVLNMKLPCAINAQELTHQEPNTPGGDAVALLANCTSSITTVLVIILGMLIMVPLQPFLQSDAVRTATTYMLPALFGPLTLSSLKENKNGKYWIKNKLVIGIIPLILAIIIFLNWDMASLYQGFLVLGAIGLCILIARILYNKGIVQVVTGPEGRPYVEGESAPAAATPAEEKK